MHCYGSCNIKNKDVQGSFLKSRRGVRTQRGFVMYGREHHPVVLACAAGDTVLLGTKLSIACIMLCDSRDSLQPDKTKVQCVWVSTILLARLCNDSLFAP